MFVAYIASLAIAGAGGYLLWPAVYRSAVGSEGGPGGYRDVLLKIALRTWVDGAKRMKVTPDDRAIIEGEIQNTREQYALLPPGDAGLYRLVDAHQYFSGDLMSVWWAARRASRELAADGIVRKPADVLLDMVTAVRHLGDGFGQTYRELDDFLEPYERLLKRQAQEHWSDSDLLRRVAEEMDEQSRIGRTVKGAHDPP
jgi:hypothetical protein